MHARQYCSVGAYILTAEQFLEQVRSFGEFLDGLPGVILPAGARGHANAVKVGPQVGGACHLAAEHGSPKRQRVSQSQDRLGLDR